MEKKTNYGKIIAITLSVIAACSAVAFVIYKLFVKDLAKCYCCGEDTDELLDEETSNDCECVTDEEPEASEE